MGIVTREFKIGWKRGFHARPCTMFIKVVSRFPKCNVLVSKGDESVNGKSIVGLLTLAAPYDSKIKVQITGERNKKCAEELQELFDSPEENL